ncbi:manganese superoxide dismutase, partial [Ephemerocybe angulata]
ADGKGTGGVLKDGPLKLAIEQVWGSLDALKEFNTATLGIQGSGWGWLGYNTQTKRLEIATTPNQDPLLSLVAIIGVDIWEHAFYLQYLNAKPDYLNAIWNVINFVEAEVPRRSFRLLQALSVISQRGNEKNMMEVKLSKHV